jgi:hypothetical protein
MGTLWTMICLAGVWGFVLSTIGFILKSFPARGVFDCAKALKWGGALLLFFIAWMVGRANA